jgi:hypothetical protein
LIATAYQGRKLHAVDYTLRENLQLILPVYDDLVKLTLWQPLHNKLPEATTVG